MKKRRRASPTRVGEKDDGRKLDFSLVDDAAEAEFVAVLTYGAEKYEPGGFRRVPNAQNRYFATLRRHLRAARSGKVLDPENGLAHLAEAACCVHFLLALALEERPALVRSLPKRLSQAIVKARVIKAQRESKKKG